MGLARKGHNDPAFDHFGRELDKESWNWLWENQFEIAKAVEQCVDLGKTPEEVKSFVIQRCGVHRFEFARRCESAARHLEAQRIP